MRFFIALGALVVSALICLLVAVVLASGYANAHGGIYCLFAPPST